LGAAAGLAVVLMLAVFSYAPLRQYPGPSVALANVQALTGSPCGLAGDVGVLVTAGRGLGPPVGGAELTGDLLAGRVAAAQPRLVEQRPVTAVTSGRPVLADQASAALWPCADQIAIAHGIVQPPEIRLRAGDGLEHATEDNTVLPGNGGTLVQVDRIVEWVELPSALSPQGVPTLDWGHVERAGYDHPAGLVDLRVDRVQRAGWTRLPTITGEAYSGRRYIG
ncbi:MAG: arabinosyltransferase C-terminal domain-containing protein, partial [Pseudonocardiaceae bacterium]